MLAWEFAEKYIERKVHMITSYLLLLIYFHEALQYRLNNIMDHKPEYVKK